MATRVRHIETRVVLCLVVNVMQGLFGTDSLERASMLRSALLLQHQLTPWWIDVLLD